MVSVLNTDIYLLIVASHFTVNFKQFHICRSRGSFWGAADPSDKAILMCECEKAFALLVESVDDRSIDEQVHLLSDSQMPQTCTKQHTYVFAARCITTKLHKTEAAAVEIPYERVPWMICTASVTPLQISCVGVRESLRCLALAAGSVKD